MVNKLWFLQIFNPECSLKGFLGNVSYNQFKLVFNIKYYYFGSI